MDQQIYAPTPSCVFFLALHLCAAPYSLYTKTTFPMSLHIYNNHATDFINFFTCMYSPTVPSSSITTVNFPYFSDSSVTFFLSFLNINNVYEYIMAPVMMEVFYDHHFYACPLNTILRHKLQHLLHFIHSSPTYAQTFFINSLLQNDVPTSV